MLDRRFEGTRWDSDHDAAMSCNLDPRRFVGTDLILNGEFLAKAFKHASTILLQTRMAILVLLWSFCELNLASMLGTHISRRLVTVSQQLKSHLSSCGDGQISLVRQQIAGLF